MESRKVIMCGGMKLYPSATAHNDVFLHDPKSNWTPFLAYIQLFIQRLKPLWVIPQATVSMCTLQMCI